MSDFDETRREIIEDLTDLESGSGGDHTKEASPQDPPSEMSTGDLISSLGELQKQAEQGEISGGSGPMDNAPSESPAKGDGQNMPNEESVPSGESAKDDGEHDGVPSGESAKNDGEHSGVPSGASAQNEGSTETGRTDSGMQTDGAPMQDATSNKKQAESMEDLPEEMQEQAEEAKEEGGVEEANESGGDSDEEESGEEESDEDSDEESEDSSNEGSDDDMPEEVKEKLNDKEAGEDGAKKEKITDRLDDKSCHDLNKVAQALETEIVEETVAKAAARTADEDAVRELTDKVAQARSEALPGNDTNAFIDSL
ncbi:hypothetical protein [Salinibacter ruber]|uniref:Uncharacterized protein n=1 Tax=Salinibacter ruber TaxID=146919 RepID=A0AAW5P7H3_9BACT|nr:hypothetical protein [Salinibacter ruber]MCS4157679.1 hypothetical protein [Salinibacter ruber]